MTETVSAAPPPRTASSGLGGKAIYEQRCASCHDHPQGSIPPREVIARRSHDKIVGALTHGAMRPYAAGLGADDIDAVARYLK